MLACSEVAQNPKGNHFYKVWSQNESIDQYEVTFVLTKGAHAFNKQLHQSLRVTVPDAPRAACEQQFADKWF